jgi:DNA-binding HxlR family transcriptional regulator
VTEPVYSCGLAAVLDLIGGKWKSLILYFLAHEQRRFSDLRRCLDNVSDKMLSQQLKEMIADGLVDRIDFHKAPPRIEYQLTKLGQDLAQTLVPLCQWGTEKMAIIVAASKQRSANKVHAGPPLLVEREIA